MQNHKSSFGPIIGSGVVVLVLIFGAVSLASKVFSERRKPTVLPSITEYERVTIPAAQATSTERGATSTLQR